MFSDIVRPHHAGFRSFSFKQISQRKTGRTLLCAGVSLLVISLSVQESRAECAPDPVEAGDEIVCTGIDENGFTTTEDEIEILVEETASVTTDGNGSAISISGSNSSFLNKGTISGELGFSTFNLISLGGVGTVVENEGNIFTETEGRAVTVNYGVVSLINREGATISSSGHADAVYLQNHFRGVVENAGTISSQGGAGIYIRTSSTSSTDRRIAVSNLPTGVIEGESGIAILSGDYLDLVNQGTIRGSVGVTANDESIIRNLSGGLIEAADYQGAAAFSALYSTTFGQDGFATFINEGTVNGTGVAVSGGAYLLENSGEINGEVSGKFYPHNTSDLTNQLVLNSGDINGSVNLSGGYDVVENSGAIMGNVELEGDSDVYRDLGGSVSGSVNLGDGDDIFLVDSDSSNGDIAGGIIAGDGYDSLGVSVAGEKSVELIQTEGFEGLAVEARMNDSVVTIEAGANAYDSTLSVLGRGSVINEADFILSGQEVVRLLSDEYSGYADSGFEKGPFGEGATLINRGEIIAQRSTTYTVSDDNVDWGLNAPVIAIQSLGDGHDRLENAGVIEGDINLGAGDDVLLNKNGLITGNIDLGTGDDLFLFLPPESNFQVDPLSGLICICVVEGGISYGGDDGVLGSVEGGDGSDAAGYYIDGTASGVLTVKEGFEAVAVYTANEESSYAITSIEGLEGAHFLHVYGSGTTINQATIDSSDYAGYSAYDNRSAVQLKGDGTNFENEGIIAGFVGVDMLANNQTFVNRGELMRDSMAGDSNGNTGFIQNHGNNNTIVNEGSVTTTAFHNAAIYVGDELSHSSARTLAEYIEAGEDLPVSRIENSGTLDGNYAGIWTETWASVEIENSGTIDSVKTTAEYGGFDLLNDGDGVIEAVSVSLEPVIYDGTLSEGNRVHAIDINIENTGSATLGTLSVRSEYPSFIVSGLLDELDVSVSIVNGENATIGSGGTAIIVKIDEEDFTASSATMLVQRSVAIDNSGTISGIINLGETDDELNNSGVLTGPVYMGDGDDSFTLSSGGSVEGTVDGGDGVDLARFEVLEGETRLASETLAFFQNFESFGVFGGGSLSFDVNPGLSSTTFDSGLVRIDDEFSGDVQVLSGATLGGNGRIGGSVNIGGTLAPGASIGTITIGGDLVLEEGAVLEIEYSDTAADLVNVGGDFTSNGGIIDFVPESDPVYGRHRLLFMTVAGEVTSNLEANVPNYLFGAVIGEGGNYYIDFETDIGQSRTMSPRAEAVVDYLNDRLNAGAAAATEDGADLIVALDVETQLDAALTGLHPEPYTASSRISMVQGLALVDSLRNIPHRKDRDGNGVMSLWASATGNFAKNDTDGVFSSYKTHSYGMLAGVDVPVADNIFLGGFLGYADYSQSFDSLDARTEGDSILFGGYADLQFDHLKIGARVAYGTGDAETRRDLGALNMVARSDYGLDSLMANGAAEYAFALKDGLTLTPFASLTHISSNRDDVVETGAGGLGLKLSDEKVNFLFSDLGLRLSGKLGEKISGQLEAGWRYDFKDELPAATAAFLEEEETFTVNGLQEGRSRIFAGAALSAELGEAWLLSLRYGAEFGDNISIHSGRLSASMKF